MFEETVVAAEPAEAAVPESVLDVESGSGSGPQVRTGRRVRWMVIGAVGLAAAGVVAYVVSSAVGGGSAGTPAPTGPLRFSAPARFQTMELRPDDPITRRIARSMVTSGGADPSAFGVVYQDTGSRMVSVVGHLQHYADPSAELDDILAKQAQSGGPLLGQRRVDPGVRGGVMECGQQDVTGFRLTGVCVWVDGDMEATYLDTVEASSIDLDQVAAAARELRKLAEVPG